MHTVGPDIVYAHEERQRTRRRSIFLAGPSPRSSAQHSWRPEAIDTLQRLGFDGTIFVPLPRDGNWSDNYEGQVEWELKHLECADAIAFWIPRSDELPGYTTNVEYGLYLKSGKVVLGYPPDAPKMRYLQKVADMYNVPTAQTLVETLHIATMLVLR